MALWKCPKQQPAKVYGVSKLYLTDSTPNWTRTDDAANFTFSPSVGSTAGASDFDKAYIYKDIKVVEHDGSKFVRIPMFYYQRYRDTSNREYVKICQKQKDGFELHPAFLYGQDGTPVKYFDIGCYHIDSTYGSKSGTSRYTPSTTQAALRTSIKAKGAGYYPVGKAEADAIAMLILIEIASYDAISKIGCSSVSGNNGATDGIAGPTGRISANTAARWRWIENFWGVEERVDGCNIYGNVYYFNPNPNTFADATYSGDYVKIGDVPDRLGVVAGTSARYVKTLTLDTSNAAFMAGKTGYATSTTYASAGMFTDDSASDKDDYTRGNSSPQNLFATGSRKTTGTNYKIASRIMYKP